MSRSPGVPNDTADGQGENQFPNQPYFQRIQQLQHAFPPFQSFLGKVNNNEDHGRRLVQKYYQDSVRGGVAESVPQEGPQSVPVTALESVPGRCYCLQFHDEKVAVLNNYPN